MKFNIKEILFWIFLAIAVILLIWYAFGNSPTEFAVMMTFIFTILLKVWTISDKQIRLEMRFNSLAKDYKEDKMAVKK